MKIFYQRLITTVLLIGSLVFLCGMDGCKMRYILSGQVTGDIQEDVEITLSGDFSDNTTTDIDGIYLFGNLDNGTYTITPNLMNYTFSPTDITVTVTDDDKTEIDFIATISPETYLISGTVIGDIQEGVTITLSDNASTITTTDANGNYLFKGLDNGTYTITPSLAGYVFSLTSQEVIIAGEDELGVDFSAAQIHTISGTVSGDTQSGVTVELTGDSTQTETTSSNGSYSFAGLINGSYTVQPSKSGYTFSPTNQSITVVDADETGIDFTATIIDLCDTVDRFLDNDDGTVTDCRTNLIWLKNANCDGPDNWDNATSLVAGLNSGEYGLSDGSAEGDWRLPTKEELQGIGTDPPTTWDSGSPGVTWTMPGVPFVSVQSSYYWSSTQYAFNSFHAWYVDMSSGYVNHGTKTIDGYVWPVRSDN